jgi:subtilisin family serine protease
MRKILALGPVTVFILFCLHLGVASSALAAKEQVIVGYFSHPDKWDEDDIQARGGKVKYRYHIIPAIAAEIDETQIDKIKKSPKVKYVEPDYELHIVQTIPNDLHPDLWALNNTGVYAGGTADADIDAPEAWDIQTGSDNVVVAVIDTGLDYNHEDLSANAWVNPGEVPGNGVDDDGNGYVDDVHGYDFYNGDSDPLDDHAHGTHCSGTIAAAGNNGIGIVGVNWRARIIALKAFNQYGGGSTMAAIASIEYATMMKQRGISVVAMSNSWGSTSYSQSMKDAISAANNAGILFVAAAGNYSRNNDATPFYPASYNVPNVISVAASDYNDNLASFSCYGATSVDLAAPGVSILSTIPGNGYSSWNGTSMATPHVTGVAALVRAEFPGITHIDIKDRVLGGVDPIPGMAGKVATGGRLNARGALDGAAPPPDPPSPPTGLVAIAEYQQISLDWNDNTEPELTGYRVYRSATPGAPYSLMGTATQSSYTDASVNGASTYYYVVTALCNQGAESDCSNEANATTPPTPPTGLVAAAGDGQVSLNWNDSAGSVTYNVYRRTAATNYNPIATVVPVSEYTDTGLVNGTTYYYVVTAVGTVTNEESGYSNEASATTAEITTRTLYVVGNSSVRYSDNVWYSISSGRHADFQFETFNAPAGKVITSVIIYVEHWEDGGFKGNVEWIVEGVSKTDVPLRSVDQTDSWDVTTILGSPDMLSLVLRIQNNSTKIKKTNIDYIYAKVEWGTPDSDPPGQVTGLVVNTASSNRLDLSWNPNTESDLGHYNVYRSGTSDAPYDLIASPATNSYSDTGLVPSTTYYYVVEAVDTSWNEGPQSAEASGTTSALPENRYMYVKSISFSTKVAGPNIFLYTDIKVVDGDARPLGNVEVDMTLQWDGRGIWPYADTTSPDGTVRFTKNKASSGEYTAEVKSLTLTNHTWDQTRGVKLNNCQLQDNGTVVQGAALASALNQFQLFQNAPNPFNPETWIPYALGRQERVVISIYDVTGRLVKALDLGERDAGVYMSKGKAAYWDGSNESGEEVSSGIYFYTLEAGSFRATRKMFVIR